MVTLNRVSEPHCVDDLTGILDMNANGPSTDIGEFFEQQAHALHDGDGRQGADISQPQDRPQT